MQRETPGQVFSDTHDNDYKVSACRITFLLELCELRSTESSIEKIKYDDYWPRQLDVYRSSRRGKGYFVERGMRKVVNG